MPTYCCCGNEFDPDRPAGYRMTFKPCQCKEPSPMRTLPLGTLGTIVRGDHPRDPARARLGLPDRTPTEKAVLRGSFNE